MSDDVLVDGDMEAVAGLGAEPYDIDPPVVVPCHKCGAPAVKVVSGWIRSSGDKKGTGWRRPAASDFRVACVACRRKAGDLNIGLELQEIIVIPPGGFVTPQDYDGLDMRLPGPTEDPDMEEPGACPWKKCSHAELNTKSVLRTDVRVQTTAERLDELALEGDLLAQHAQTAAWQPRYAELLLIAQELLEKNERLKDGRDEAVADRSAELEATNRGLAELVETLRQDSTELEAEVGRLKDGIDLLFHFVPDWAQDVPDGLDPTFYGTGTAHGDRKVKAKVDALRDREVIEAAAPGPWTADAYPDDQIWGPDDDLAVAYDCVNPANLEFICRARTRWPAALELVHRHQLVLDKILELTRQNAIEVHDVIVEELLPLLEKTP